MTILSREEAMRLPFEQRPMCYRLPGHIYTRIFESVGAASFDPTRAERIAVELCDFIATELKQAAEPPDFIRASGECLCRECGKSYYSHEPHHQYRWLSVLCNGVNVKL